MANGTRRNGCDHLNRLLLLGCSQQRDELQIFAADLGSEVRSEFHRGEDRPVISLRKSIVWPFSLEARHSRSTTFARDFAADSLQMQQTAVASLNHSLCRAGRWAAAGQIGLDAGPTEN